MLQTKWQEMRERFVNMMIELRNNEDCWCHEKRMDPDEVNLFVIGIKGDKVEFLQMICTDTPPQQAGYWKEFVEDHKKMFLECIGE